MQQVIVVREEYCGVPEKVIRLDRDEELYDQIGKHYEGAMYSNGGFDLPDGRGFVFDIVSISN